MMRHPGVTPASLLMLALMSTVCCQAGQSQVNTTQPRSPRSGGFIENKGENKVKAIKTNDKNIKQIGGTNIKKDFDIISYQISDGSDKIHGRNEKDSKEKKNSEIGRNFNKTAENFGKIFKVNESNWKNQGSVKKLAQKYHTKVYKNKDSKIKVYKNKEKGIKIYQISDLEEGYSGGGKMDGVLGSDCAEGTLIGQHGWWKDEPLKFRSRKSRSPHRQQDSSSEEDGGTRSQGPRRRRPVCHDFTAAFPTSIPRPTFTGRTSATIIETTMTPRLLMTPRTQQTFIKSNTDSTTMWSDNWISKSAEETDVMQAWTQTAENTTPESIVEDLVEFNIKSTITRSKTKFRVTPKAWPTKTYTTKLMKTVTLPTRQSTKNQFIFMKNFPTSTTNRRIFIPGFFFTKTTPPAATDLSTERWSSFNNFFHTMPIYTYTSRSTTLQLVTNPIIQAKKSTETIPVFTRTTPRLADTTKRFNFNFPGNFFRPFTTSTMTTLGLRTTWTQQPFTTLSATRPYTTTQGSDYWSTSSTEEKFIDSTTMSTARSTVQRDDPYDLSTKQITKINAIFMPISTTDVTASLAIKESSQEQFSEALSRSSVVMETFTQSSENSDLSTAFNFINNTIQLELNITSSSNLNITSVEWKRKNEHETQISQHGDENEEDLDTNSNNNNEAQEENGSQIINNTRESSDNNMNNIKKTTQTLKLSEASNEDDEEFENNTISNNSSSVNNKNLTSKDVVTSSTDGTFASPSLNNSYISNNDTDINKYKTAINNSSRLDNQSVEQSLPSNITENFSLTSDTNSSSNLINTYNNSLLSSNDMNNSSSSFVSTSTSDFFMSFTDGNQEKIEQTEIINSSGFSTNNGHILDSKEYMSVTTSVGSNINFTNSFMNDSKELMNNTAITSNNSVSVNTVYNETAKKILTTTNENSTFNFNSTDNISSAVDATLSIAQTVINTMPFTMVNGIENATITTSSLQDQNLTISPTLSSSITISEKKTQIYNTSTVNFDNLPMSTTVNNSKEYPMEPESSINYKITKPIEESKIVQFYATQPLTIWNNDNNKQVIPDNRTLIYTTTEPSSVRDINGSSTWNIPSAETSMLGSWNSSLISSSIEYTSGLNKNSIEIRLNNTVNSNNAPGLNTGTIMSYFPNTRVTARNENDIKGESGRAGEKFTCSDVVLNKFSTLIFKRDDRRMCAQKFSSLALFAKLQRNITEGSSSNEEQNQSMNENDARRKYSECIVDCHFTGQSLGGDSSPVDMGRLSMLLVSTMNETLRSVLEESVRNCSKLMQDKTYAEKKYGMKPRPLGACDPKPLQVWRCVKRMVGKHCKLIKSGRKRTGHGSGGLESILEIQEVIIGRGGGGRRRGDENGEHEDGHRRRQGDKRWKEEEDGPERKKKVADTNKPRSKEEAMIINFDTKTDRRNISPSKKGESQTKILVVDSNKGDSSRRRNVNS